MNNNKIALGLLGVILSTGIAAGVEAPISVGGQTPSGNRTLTADKQVFEVIVATQAGTCSDPNKIYLNPDTTECEVCGKGYECPDQNTKTACGDGKYSDEENLTACKPVGDGYKPKKEGQLNVAREGLAYTVVLKDASGAELGRQECVYGTPCNLAAPTLTDQSRKISGYAIR
ncbi:MAG: hypothetical protein LBL46_01985 [Rickettsiales bacterium]|jgi:hypothetical protein|nr:hypothetical protein [Rickettsiales bacterium]